MKAGDRILKVNGVDVSHASQMETHSLLKTGEGTCILEIEYDVTLHGTLNRLVFMYPYSGKLAREKIFADQSTCNPMWHAQIFSWRKPLQVHAAF